MEVKGRFLRRVAHHLRHRGFCVRPPCRGSESAPEGWRGLPPDLYAEKGEVRLAFAVASEAGPWSDHTFRRARTALLNPGVRVVVYVRSRQSARLARRFRAGLPPELAARVQVCRLVIPRSPGVLVDMAFILHVVTMQQAAGLALFLFVVGLTFTQASWVLPLVEGYLRFQLALLFGH